MYGIYTRKESHEDFCEDFLSIFIFGMDPKKLLFKRFFGFCFVLSESISFG